MPTDESVVEIDLKDPRLAAFLAWLVPGLGHIYQGRTGKGVLFFVCIVGTFFYGCTSAADALCMLDGQRVLDAIPARSLAIRLPGRRRFAGAAGARAASASSRRQAAALRRQIHATAVR